MAEKRPRRTWAPWFSANPPDADEVEQLIEDLGNIAIAVAACVVAVECCGVEIIIEAAEALGVIALQILT